MPDRQRLPRPAEHDLLVRDEPRKSDRVDRRIRAHPRRGRLRGARRRVTLRVRVELDDLRAREDLRRLLREAHHQHCPLREVRRMEARNSRVPARPRSVASRSKPVVPMTTGTPRVEAQRDVVRPPHPGVVKSTAASQPAGPASARVDDVVTGLGREQARASCRPFLPRRTARSASGRLLEERRIDALDGLGEPLLVRADPGDREPVGREQRVRELRDLVGRDGYEPLRRSLPARAAAYP